MSSTYHVGWLLKSTAVVEWRTWTTQTFDTSSPLSLVFAGLVIANNVHFNYTNTIYLNSGQLKFQMLPAQIRVVWKSSFSDWMVWVCLAAAFIRRTEKDWKSTNCRYVSHAWKEKHVNIDVLPGTSKWIKFRVVVHIYINLSCLSLWNSHVHNTFVSCLVRP